MAFGGQRDFWCSSIVNMAVIEKSYQTIAAEKQLQRSTRIPKDWLLSESYRSTTNLMEIPLTCGILDEVECDITSNHDATSLLEKLKSGYWSAERVTIAFCKRAAIAQQLVGTHPITLLPLSSHTISL